MNLKFRKLFAPISLPIFFFVVAIIIGAILLHSSFSCYISNISWLDALFTATSAVCVTGLTVVDTGNTFTQIGQTILIALIQLGGLGIMSFSSLAFYLWKRRVSLTDRIAVGQTLLHDSRFHLGKFLIQIVTVTFIIELSGALILFVIAPNNFTPFSAIFHSISAFCNAGFSLNADSLMYYKGNWPINLTIICLIILGGAGFSVLIEGKSFILSLIRGGVRRRKRSWHFTIVVKTSFILIIVGWVFLFFSEFINYKEYLPLHEAILTSLFQ
ncbi:MAG: potassium transporter TrkH, partial [Nitrospirae bacterium]